MSNRVNWKEEAKRLERMLIDAREDKEKDRMAMEATVGELKALRTQVDDLAKEVINVCKERDELKDQLTESRINEKSAHDAIDTYVKESENAFRHYEALIKAQNLAHATFVEGLSPELPKFAMKQQVTVKATTPTTIANPYSAAWTKISPAAGYALYKHATKGA